MKRILLTCLIASYCGVSAQIGPPQIASPNTNNGYGITQTSGTYTPLSASRTIWQTGDTMATDLVSAAIPLPSTFTYNNQKYNSVYISNNGFVTLGGAMSNGTYTALSTDISPTTPEAVFAGFAANLKNANTTTSEISYETVGSVFIVQFTDVQGNSGSASQLLNFQIQMNLTSGTVALVYGNCVSGTANLVGQVGIRGSEGSDINNFTGTNWSALTPGTSTTSNPTLGTSNGTTVPASGLTFTYSPGTWLAAPTTFATLPFTEDFSAWANGNSTLDLPNANYWRTWPARGDNSWRQSNVSSTGFTSASGWTGSSGSVTLGGTAVVPAARFHSYNCQYASGYMDLYINLSSGSGDRILSFDYVNPTGTDVLKIQLSTDGGATFTDVGSPFGTTTSTWVTNYVNLASSSPNAIIRFLAKGDNGSDDIYVDNVKISAVSVAPDCTTITSPANAATGVAVVPTLKWNASPSATSYKMNLGTTPGGTNLMNGVDVGNVVSYTLPTAAQLLYGTTYYATILPFNSTGTANGCTETSFTTKNIGCPTVSAPSSSATGVSILPTITWSAVTDATGYKISIGTTTGGSDIMNNVDVGNVTSYTLATALNYNTKYYYTVNAYTATSTSASCTERSFTTATLCPSVSAPGSAATGVSILPTITWSAIIGVTGYRITMGTTAGGNDIMDNVDVGNVTTYTFTTPLAFGTKYYYKVIAYSGSTVGTACTERNFTTSTLCPSISSPSSGATGVSLAPTISWNAITGVTGYRISMGTTSGGTDILNNVDVGNVTSYTHATPLAFTTKYYYTVTGYTGTLTGTGCSVNNFTTQGACPVVTYPAAGATLQPITPLIKWNAMPTAAYYTLTIGTTAGGSDIMNNVNIGNVTSYTVTAPLTLGTKYYYKVNTDTSTACTERSFTVNASPAPANDNCSGALMAASFPYTYSQTDGVGATNGAGFITACSGSNDGMWFKFTGNGSEITVAAKSTTAWDHRVSVYSGGCEAFVCVGTADENASTLGNIETFTFNSVAGTVYYVNVGYYSSSSDSAEGNFDLSITSATLATSEVVTEKIKEIKVYPNPFTDILNISDISKVQSVAVVDLAGRVVKTIEKPSSGLQLADLKQGMYLIVLHMKDGSRQVVKSIKR